MNKNILPKFVRLYNIEFRLIGDRYYRDCGHYYVDYVIKDNKMFSSAPQHPQ